MYMCVSALVCICWCICVQHMCTFTCVLHVHVCLCPSTYMSHMYCVCMHVWLCVRVCHMLFLSPGVSSCILIKVPWGGFRKHPIAQTLSTLPGVRRTWSVEACGSQCVLGIDRPGLGLMASWGSQMGHRFQEEAGPMPQGWRTPACFCK